MKKILLVLAILACVSMTGCSEGGSDSPTESPKTASLTIKIYSDCPSAVGPIEVKIDGKKVGDLPQGGQLVVTVSVGTHRVEGTANDNYWYWWPLDIEVPSAGMTYYFKCSEACGGIMFRLEANCSNAGVTWVKLYIDNTQVDIIDNPGSYDLGFYRPAGVYIVKGVANTGRQWGPTSVTVPAYDWTLYAMSCGNQSEIQSTLPPGMQSDQSIRRVKPQ